MTKHEKIKILEKEYSDLLKDMGMMITNYGYKDVTIRLQTRKHNKSKVVAKVPHNELAARLYQTNYTYYR